MGNILIQNNVGLMYIAPTYSCGQLTLNFQVHVKLEGQSIGVGQLEGYDRKLNKNSTKFRTMLTLSTFSWSSLANFSQKLLCLLYTSRCV